jgi:hypothetical protein
MIAIASYAGAMFSIPFFVSCFSKIFIPQISNRGRLLLVKNKNVELKKAP